MSDSAEVKSCRAPVADNPLEPQFKVVQLNGKRRGIRLERLYWSLLDTIAQRLKIRRSRLVANLVEEAEQKGAPVASYMRTFVAKSLDEDRRGTEAGHSAQTLVNLLQQAPVPAFSINRQKQLRQVNAEFLELLKRMNPKLIEPGATDVVQLVLDTPVEELFQRLRATPSVHCSYSIHFNTLRSRGRAKIVCVPGNPSEFLVGYVLS